MNKIILTGNLTKDPMAKTTTNEKTVVSGSIAVKKAFKDGADFFDFEVWENQADYLVRYGHKGDRVELVGSMESYEYSKKDGTTAKGWRVRISEISVISAKSDEPKATSESPKTFDAVEETNDDLPF